jgi:nucleotide-binding universal stress UspA family protein
MKSILLHVHTDDGQEARFQSALDVARLMNAHITCIQVMPYGAYVGEPFTGVVMADEAYQQAMEATREKVEADLANEGVSWDWVDRRGGGAAAILAQSMLADLIVLSRPGRALDPAGNMPIVGEIAVRSSAPALIVSDQQQGFDGEAPALIAWNGKPEAANAIKRALPLIARSKAVHVVSIGEDGDALPASDAASYMSRHGLKVETHGRARGKGSVADAILSVAGETRAGYLVMGAYGHSRLAELLLGGVTRAMLDKAEIPLVLAH